MIPRKNEKKLFPTPDLRILILLWNSDRLAPANRRFRGAPPTFYYTLRSSILFPFCHTLIIKQEKEASSRSEKVTIRAWEWCNHVQVIRSRRNS